MAGPVSLPSSIETKENNGSLLSIERLQKLLLPQYWEDIRLWKKECNDVCEIFDKQALSKNFCPLDLSVWVSGERPRLKWPERALTLKMLELKTEDTKMARSNPNPRTDSERIYSEITDFPNPLWGWISLLEWFFQAMKDIAIQAELISLFQILMRCGCNTRANLNKRNAQRRTLLSFCRLHSWAAEQLLMRPLLDVCINGSTPVVKFSTITNVVLCCCDICVNLTMSIDSDRVPTTDHVTFMMLQRLTQQDHLSLFRCPHSVLLLSALRRCLNTFCALWNVAVNSDDHTLYSIIANTCIIESGSDVCWSLLATIAMWKLDTPWNLLCEDTSGLSSALLKEANADEMQHYLFPSPLYAAMTAFPRQHKSDLRAAWLLPRLRTEHWNRYFTNGYVPFTGAMILGYPITLRLLLQAGVAVDLTLDTSDIEGTIPTMLFRDRTKFIPFETTKKDSSISPNLLKELEEQRNYQLTTQPKLVRDVIMPLLLTMNVPRDIIRIVFQYARIPEPDVWLGAVTTLSQDVKSLLGNKVDPLDESLLGNKVDECKKTEVAKPKTRKRKRKDLNTSE